MSRSFQYWWLVCKTAFRHSFLTAEHLIFGLAIALGLATLYWPEIKITLEGSEVDVHGWKIAAIALAAVIAVRLLLAPYWIYEEQIARMAKLQNRLRDKLAKKQTREQLGFFLERGKRFLVMIKEERKHPTHEITEWDNEVKRWLNDNLDTSYGARFRSPRTQHKAPHGIGSSELRDTWEGVRFRLDNLNQFLEEFS